MATRSTGSDRRAQRTRRAIRHAAIAVARERGIRAATVSAIAERADVSRGTFYAHYADKEALIVAIARQEYRRRMGQIPPPSAWDDQATRLLIQHTLEYVRDVYLAHAAPGRSLEVGAVITEVILDELRARLTATLDQARRSTGEPDDPTETVSTALAWAIYGTAVTWSKQSGNRSLSQATGDLLRLVVGAIRLAPR